MITLETFKYKLEQEPTENWTVEEALQWAYLQSQKKLQDDYDAQVARWRAMMSQGLSGGPAAVVSTESASKNPPERQPYLSLKILCGEQHVGETITLTPTVNKPCKVGRSKGKAFRQGGLSLPKDLEVSTTHGQFELRLNSTTGAPELYFTDLESTNGTSLVRTATLKQTDPVVAWTLTEDRQVCVQDAKGTLTILTEEALVADEPMLLEDGCVLHIGATLLALQIRLP